MSTPCQTCIPLDCTVPSDIAQFSNTLSYWNPQYSFVVNCPPGYECLQGIWPRIITIPEGEIEINVPESPAGQLTLRCCESTITRTVAADATQDQIALIANEMIYECAAQQARCNNLIIPPRPTKKSIAYRYYTNNVEITAQCTDGRVDINEFSLSITPRIAVNAGVVTIQPGSYSLVNPALMNAPEKFLYSSLAVANNSPSNASVLAAIADANAKAQSFANSLFNTYVASGKIECGWFNEEQEYTAECVPANAGDPVTVTIAAGTIGSTASQSDANIQAKMQAKEDAEALLDCGCDANPNVPFPAALVQVTGVDLESIQIADDHVSIPFLNAPGGSYQINYASGAFTMERVAPAPTTYYYTEDTIITGPTPYPIVRANWANTITGTTQTSLCQGSAINTNAATVAAQTTAHNPLSTFISSEVISCNLETRNDYGAGGSLFGLTGVIPPYAKSAATTTFTLHQVKKVLYPQPLRVQISDYAIVAAQLTPCAICDPAVSPAWNGKVPRRKFLELSLDEPVWVYDVPSEGDPAVSIGAFEMDSIYIDYAPISGYWYISLYAKHGAGFELIWGGYKNKGTTPVGHYTRDDGICTAPQCISLEEY